MGGYQERLEAFAELGFSIVAGTVDSEEKTLEVAKPLSFPVAYGMSRADGDAIGSWWDEKRDFIQPSEFILRGNKVMASTYSNSPVGRMDPAETLMLVQYLVGRENSK